MVQHLYIRFIRMPLLFRILLVAGLNMFIFGAVIHAIEPNTFPTIFDGIWWALMTASTVGYGDYVPITLPGRITAIILLFAGAGFLSSYFVTLSAAAVNMQEEYYEGKTAYKGEGHLIIIGWNERSKKIARCFGEKKKPVVLIDESLDSHPHSKHGFHFIKGASHLDEILLKAGLSSACKVIITADQNLVEHQADKNTVLTLLAIKGINSDVHCIAEVLTKSQINNAFRAGADEIIQTNELAGSMFLNSLQHPGIAAPLQEVLNAFDGNELKMIPASDITGHKTFGQAHACMLSKGMLLIGIKKGDDVIVNPPVTADIGSKDILLVVV
ncbi:potassium channel family protein [Mesobacillus zeae]|uniref:Potassium channel protein n=1 Tax=Mesobacillus zeae TaxID=1917180 RepID=A0A398BNA3_9BACI|nr:potassium channel family protein [Mesobacillus zeae]RID88836.1 potassium channel protein [Mesobacillus zeae]